MLEAEDRHRKQLEALRESHAQESRALQARVGDLTERFRQHLEREAGEEAVAEAEEAGTRKGFTFEERAIPRHGYPVWFAGESSGAVCSGAMSPSLGIPIGTCYLPAAGAAEGTEFEVEIRGKRITGRVVKPPFYKDASHL